MPFASLSRTTRPSYATVQKSPSREKHHSAGRSPCVGVSDRNYPWGATSAVATPQGEWAEWSEAPGDRPLRDVRAEHPGPERVVQVPPETRVTAPDALEGAPDLVRDRLARALGRVARRPRTAAEPVRAGELLGDLLDLVARAGGAAEVAGIGRFLEVVAQLVEPPLVLGARPRIEHRSEVSLHERPCERPALAVSALAQPDQVRDVDLRAGGGEQVRDVVETLGIAQADDPAVVPVLPSPPAPPPAALSRSRFRP